MAGDLNLKKSWNPQLVKNQKKVYEEEQAKLQEYKRIKEKAHELSKEQEYLNLLKLQYGDNFNIADLSKNEKMKLSKTNWMYTDHQPTSTVNSSGFNEVNLEFLDGKKKVESLLLGSRSVVATSSSKINSVLTSGKKVASTSSKDDPLALISKMQRLKSTQNSSSRGDSDRRSDSSRNRIHKSRSESSRSRHESNGDGKYSSSRRHRTDSERSGSRSDRDYKTHGSDYRRDRDSKSRGDRDLSSRDDRHSRSRNDDSRSDRYIGDRGAKDRNDTDYNKRDRSPIRHT